jgi:hypothetical protein
VGDRAEHGAEGGVVQAAQGVVEADGDAGGDGRGDLQDGFL